MQRIDPERKNHIQEGFALVQPTLLAIAKADLITAERLVDSDNKYIKHQAAYMTQQSIEKTLKYLINLKTGSQPWGHDIEKLIRLAKSSGIPIPETIDKHKTLYSSWEAVTRYYPQAIIRRDMIQKAITATKDWHYRLKKEGIK